MAEQTSYRPRAFETPNAGEAFSAPGAARTDGVLGRRFFAYLVDILIVFGLVTLLAIAIFIIGIVTFTLGWGLYALLFPPLVAIVYNALTIGGPAQSTLGMRMTGLRVVDAGNGGRVDKITAAVHALLFYLAAGTFILLAIDVFIGMMRPDRRLGHDLLTGVMLVRRL
jgi:uncharacterized RDD family membrane protein YckC